MQLFSRLEALSADVDLFSFDIFDTLLERYVEPPEAVKAMAARQVAAHFPTESGGLTPEVLLTARRESEATLRRRAQKSGFDHECAFSDIATEMARQLTPEKQEALRAALVEGELEAEGEALFLRPQAAELLAALRSQGKRIVAVSDMYLDGVMILRLFGRFGLDKLVDRVYVSADVKLGKYSGRLFRHVLEAEGIPPARMVHVGDHPQSDVAAPRSLGIRALHLHERASLRRREEVRTLHWLGERDPFWRGEHLLRMIPSPQREIFITRYGYGQLGPIYRGFALGVLEIAAAVSKGFWREKRTCSAHCTRNWAPASVRARLRHGISTSHANR